MTNDKKMNYEVPNHGKYLFPTFETISKFKFKKWEYNREPAECKIKEITDIILKKKRCEGVIYVAKINGKYNCYDGWHRYNAIQKSLEEDSNLKNCTVILFVLKVSNNEDLNKVKVIELMRSQIEKITATGNFREYVPVHFFRLLFAFGGFLV